MDENHVCFANAVSHPLCIYDLAASHSRSPWKQKLLRRLRHMSRRSLPLGLMLHLFAIFDLPTWPSGTRKTPSLRRIVNLSIAKHLAPSHKTPAPSCYAPSLCGACLGLQRNHVKLIKAWHMLNMSLYGPLRIHKGKWATCWFYSCSTPVAAKMMVSGACHTLVFALFLPTAGVVWLTNGQKTQHGKYTASANTGTQQSLHRCAITCAMVCLYLWNHCFTVALADAELTGSSLNRIFLCLGMSL